MDDSTPAKARALFVLGAPRSGTTLVGGYLGSAPNVLDLGEYGGFYAAYGAVPSMMGKYPGPYRDAYLEDLTHHAREFAEEAATEAGCSWYCDGTPWNLQFAARLAEDLPEAVFVLTLRHYAGAVQSLRRSYANGFMWAGASFEEGARLWAAMYSHVGELPADRTVLFDYDALGAEPERTLASLREDAGAHGLDTRNLDAGVLAVSHATSPGVRPTVGRREGDTVRLDSFPTVDVDAWSGDIHGVVWPAVRDVHMDLKARYGSAYVTPPPPERFRRHDEIRGLVDYEPEGW